MTRAPNFRAWLKNAKKMKDVTSLNWFHGKLDDVCFDYEEVGYMPEDVALMQSTGLKDKNGVEIFEGDVVKVDVPNPLMCGVYEVRRAKSGAWRIDNNIQGRELWLAGLGDAEVIGSIYETPELLEE